MPRPPADQIAVELIEEDVDGITEEGCRGVEGTHVAALDRVEGAHPHHALALHQGAPGESGAVIECYEMLALPGLTVVRLLSVSQPSSATARGVLSVAVCPSPPLFGFEDNACVGAPQQGRETESTHHQSKKDAHSVPYPLP